MITINTPVVDTKQISEEENHTLAAFFFKIAEFTLDRYNISERYGILNIKREREQSSTNYMNSLTGNIMFFQICYGNYLNIISKNMHKRTSQINLTALLDDIDKVQAENKVGKTAFKQERESLISNIRNTGCIGDALIKELEFQYCFYGYKAFMCMEYIYFLSTEYHDNFLETSYSNKPFSVYKEILDSYITQHCGIIGGKWGYVPSVKLDCKPLTTSQLDNPSVTSSASMSNNKQKGTPQKDVNRAPTQNQMSPNENLQETDISGIIIVGGIIWTIWCTICGFFTLGPLGPVIGPAFGIMTTIGLLKKVKGK